MGITLLALGAWIFYSISRSQGEEFVLQSRWMFILSKIRQASSWLSMRITGKPLSTTRSNMSRCNAPTAFGIGVIHGFGAETGTQVLLIAAVGGSTHALGSLILLSFILGLLISNTVVAILTCVGFTNSLRFKPLLVITSVLTGMFSLIIGGIFASGNGNVLPDLHR
ncbi:MAG: hypothetical protein ACRD3W_25785 [Terriglobales bacterium]